MDLGPSEWSLGPIWAHGFGSGSRRRGSPEAKQQGRRIFVLDIRAAVDSQVSPGTDESRSAAGSWYSSLDEYQQYVTPGGKGSQGDPEYLETSRSFRAIDIAATQQLSALQDAVGGRDAAQRVIGSFNSLVLFRHNDHALTQYAGHLVGRRERQERSYNVSEGGQDAERHNLLGDAFAADKQSVTRSVSERMVERDVITDDLFAGLQTFEAIGIFSSEHGRDVVRFNSKPQWVPARTPQHVVLEQLEGRPPRTSWAERLRRWAVDEVEQLRGGRRS